MQKLDARTDGATVNIVEENIERLRELFPDAFTESSIEGEPRFKVDFDALPEILGDYTEDQQERYRFTWNGKARARRIAQTPSMGTLRPCPEASVNWDTTQNLFIEGDNLEVLKLLQKSYHHRVKMIYIDPPYNTSKEFIYPDKFQDNLDTYLRYTGQIDDEGFKLSANAETAGRYHTNWLNMMYPRLTLARNLLRDDGIIFISIDDNEDSNLRKLCDEVFGEENFLTKIIIQSNKRDQTYKEIAKCHEYLFVYYKSASSSLGELEKEDGSLPFQDENGCFDLWELRNRNPQFGRHNRPNLYYPIYVDPNSGDDDGLFGLSLEHDEQFSVAVLPKNSQGEDSCWRWGKEKVLGDGIGATPQVLFDRMKRDGGWNIYQKSRKSTTKAKSIWADTGVISEQGTVEAGRIEMGGMLEFPKPLEMIRRCVQLATESGDLVLDFFAGSGTTAHAVFQQCLEDKQPRRCISVQLPEPTYEYKDGKRVPKGINKKAYKASLETIADIAKERIRRAAATIREEHPKYEGDLEFKVFTLDASNIKPWDADFDNLDQALFDSVENIKPDRSETDVLYELLLKFGLDLALPIEERTIAGKTVFIIGAGALIVCLASDVTIEAVEGVAKLKEELNPEIMRVVFKDAGFKDDVVKTNAVQILRQAGIEDVKSL